MFRKRSQIMRDLSKRNFELNYENKCLKKRIKKALKYIRLNGYIDLNGYDIEKILYCKKVKELEGELKDEEN